MILAEERGQGQREIERRNNVVGFPPHRTERGKKKKEKIKKRKGLQQTSVFIDQRRGVGNNPRKRPPVSVSAADGEGGKVGTCLREQRRDARKVAEADKMENQGVCPT
jgi:hypothetical protein